MKFKSAEADWNVLFVPQIAWGRNLWRFLTRKLYRRDAGGWVYWAGGDCANLIRGEVADEERDGVCWKFFDELAAAGWFVRGGTECNDSKGEEVCGYDNDRRGYEHHGSEHCPGCECGCQQPG
jgi:hypothetical protein